MIHVDRSRVPKPSFFSSAEHKSLRAEVAQQLQRSSKSKEQSRINFEFSHIKGRDVATALERLFVGRCAYCEQRVDRKTGEVEQHRPALLYPWLAYEWDNLYLSCQECNRNKGGRFPLTVGSQRVTDPDQDLTEEKPLLLDPCVDQPEYHLCFDAQGGVRSVSGMFGMTDRGRDTIDILGLDRKSLQKRRRQAAKRLESSLSGASAESKAASTLRTWFVKELRRELAFAGLRRQLLTEWVLDQRDVFDSASGDAESWITKGLGDAGYFDVSVALRGPQPDVTSDTEPKTTDEPEPGPPPRPRDGRSRWGIADKEETALPISNAVVKSIAISNFKAIHSLRLVPQLSPAEGVLEYEVDESSISTLMGWMTLLGENGSGKSSVLQAVALALAGEQISHDPLLRPEKFLMRGMRVGRVELEMTRGEPIKLQITKRAFTFESGGNPHGAFVRAYGPTRLLPNQKSNVPVSGKSPRVEYKNMFDPFIPLTDADTWLTCLCTGEQDNEFRPARLAIKDLLGLDDDQMVEQKGGEVTVDGQPLENLSAGYQTIVALACDIMAGIPEMLSDMQLAQGIVLVDEIGAHLHPAWKMRIVSRLRKAFPLLQFIVSTHEPLCLRGLSEGEVAVIKREVDPTVRTKSGTVPERRVRVEHDTPSPRSMRVDQLLTSNHFGLNSTIDPQTDDLFTEYYQLLARRDELNPELEARRDELSRRLQHCGVLGYTRRDQLVYEAIDAYLADERANKTIDATKDDGKRQEQRRGEVKTTVAGLWRYAQAFDRRDET